MRLFQRGSGHGGRFHVKAGEEPVEPARDPPGRAAEELHDGGDEHQPHDGGVDEDRRRHADAHQLEEDLGAEDEGEEDNDHDRGGGGDHARGPGDPFDDGAVCLPVVQVLLAHAREQEHLVVHREAEQDREHDHRDRRGNGRLVVDAEESAGPAALGEVGEHAVGGADREQVEDACLERERRGAEGGQDQQQRQPQHGGDEERQPRGDELALVDEGRGLSADVDGQPVLGLVLRQDVVAQPLDEVGGGVLLGRGGRDNGEHGGVAGLVEPGLAGRGDTGDVAEALRDPAQLRTRLRTSEVGGEHERPVGAGAEAFADQVVGLPRRHLGGVVACVREAEPQPERGRGEHEQDCCSGDRRRPRSPLHAAAPARRGSAVAALAEGATEARDVQPVHLRAEEGKEGRKQGDGGCHHHQHGEAGRDGDTAKAGDADEEETQDRDYDGRAGDQDAAPCRLDRFDRCRATVGAGGERRAEAGEDQERVVDADADPEQSGNGRRPVGDVEHGRDHADQGGGDAEAEQRCEQRETGGNNRSEGDQQDEGGGDERDQLGRRALLLDAAHLDAQTASACRLGQLDQLGARRARHVPGGAVEREPSDRDRAVAGDLHGFGRADAVEALCALEEALHPRLDDRAAYAARGLPDDVEGVAGAALEALGQQRGGGSRLRARRQVVLVEVAGDARREHDDRGEHGDPGQQHAAAPPVGEVGQACERCHRGTPSASLLHATDGRRPAASAATSRGPNLFVLPWYDAHRLAGRFRPAAGALTSTQGVSPMRVCWNEAGRRYLTFGTAIAALVLILGQVVLFTGGFGTPEPDVRDGDVLGAALVALATVPLAFRALWPLAVFLISTGTTVVLYALEYPGELALIPIVAVHSLAASADDPRRARILATIATAGFAVLSVLSLIVFEPDVGLLSLAVFWGAAWVARAHSRLRRERIAELEERARRAEREAERERQLAAAEERGRIARELHDSAGHAINAILLQLEAARVLRAREPARAEAALDTVARVARETIAEIDALVGALREKGPAEVTPPPGIDDIESLVSQHRSDGLLVAMDVGVHARPCTPAIDRAAYRIVQEALTNAARYGQGSVRVALIYGDSALELDIENPIRDSGVTRAGGGHGLAGMRERVELLGGTLTAAANGSVFRVHARLPYERANR